MNRILTVDSAGTQQEFFASDFPLALGVSINGLPLVGDVAEADAVAWLGQQRGDIFIEPVKGSRGVCLDGRLLEDSAWLVDGGTFTIGHRAVVVAKRDGVLTLSVVEEQQDDARREPESAGASLPPTRIGPIRHRRIRAFKILMASFLVLVVGVVFVVAASPLRVVISPEPDSVSLRGLFPGVPFVGRYLVLPGRYSVVAEKQGFRKLERDITVAFGSEPVLEYKLVELPGYLDVTSNPATAANVTINGKRIGTTPLKSFEIDSGQYELRVVADRYRPFSQTIEVRGKGNTERVEVSLIPAWGTLEITSEPSDARVILNGIDVGTTPLRAEPGSGQYRVELRKNGWKPMARAGQIKVSETVTLPVFRLEKINDSPVAEQAVASAGKVAPRAELAPTQLERALEPSKTSSRPATATAKMEGSLAITTSPGGAMVSVNGEARGSSPITVTLVPGDHKIVVHKAGFETATRTVNMDGDGAKSLQIDLAAQYGIVFLNTRPAGATLTVDGKFAGSASQRLQLTAEAHRLEITRRGYASQSVVVTPSAGVSKTIEVTLDKLGESAGGGTANELKTAGGQALRLIRLTKPARFQMGAPRGEAGRRSNETVYWVELTRSFYISEKEVTNKEFQRFNAQHKSGSENGMDLNGPDQPVVSVSWDDAVRYLNWLSKEDGLPPAYREADGKMIAIDPSTSGYRLPTEAEWTFVARYEGGHRPPEQPLKYPWEGGIPPPSGSGNYADEAASGKVPLIIKGYSDGHVVSAPVGKYTPNKAGIFDLGGNVSEWVHDYYDVHIGGRDGAVRDPMGPSMGTAHVVRGASWRHGSITELRLSYRDDGRKLRTDLGFRIVRYVTEPTK